jgi:hypothetical protein
LITGIGTRSAMLPLTVFRPLVPLCWVVISYYLVIQGPEKTTGDVTLDEPGCTPQGSHNRQARWPPPDRTPVPVPPSGRRDLVTAAFYGR